MKQALFAIPVLALSGCLSDTSNQYVDVTLSPTTYAMLYGDTPSRAAATPLPAPQPVVAQPVAVQIPPEPIEIRPERPKPTPVVAKPAPKPPAPAPAATNDTCGKTQYQKFVGGPVRATLGLDIPPLSRYYGKDEQIDPRITPARLNFVVSTTNPAEALQQGGTITRVFCG